MDLQKKYKPEYIMETATLVKKPRCPKGQTRNKQGDCVPKKEKAPPIIKTKKATSPKRKTVKKQKQMTKTQAVKVLAQRRKCIERFRNAIV
jgi:hypothetical protein